MMFRKKEPLIESNSLQTLMKTLTHARLEKCKDENEIKEVSEQGKALAERASKHERMFGRRLGGKTWH